MSTGSLFRTLTIASAFTLTAVSTAQAESTVPAGQLNLTSSRVYTFVDKTGLGHQHAVEGKLKSGSCVLGVQQNAGQLVFDMTSFDADTANARRYLGLGGQTDASTRQKVNANMKGGDVLNVRAYPTATFDIRSSMPTGQKGRSGHPIYELIGEFTLHGTRRPLKVQAEAESTNGWIHLRGRFAINQTSFGIRPFSTAFGAIGVADKLTIAGDLWVAPTDNTETTAAAQTTTR